MWLIIYRMKINFHYLIFKNININKMYDGMEPLLIKAESLHYPSIRDNITQ